MAGNEGMTDGVHHVGASVSDLGRALAFWEPFVGRPARWRGTLERAYVGTHVGYPGIRIEAAMVDLGGGVVLELLDYQTPERSMNDEATANPGNVHLCVLVPDCEQAFRHAVALGARPVRPDGPVLVDAGPNEGARVAYLRVHDGITLELYEPRAGDGAATIA